MNEEMDMGCLDGANCSSELQEALVRLENVLRLFPGVTLTESADIGETHFVELNDDIKFRWRDVRRIIQDGRKAMRVVRERFPKEIKQ